MKPSEFVKEDIVTDAHDMHRDHEVQMARGDCYNAAKYAIDLHKMLQHISEAQGLDGWVSEKLTLANDYLRTVHEYLSHEMSHMDESAGGMGVGGIAVASSVIPKMGARKNSFRKGTKK